MANGDDPVNKSNRPVNGQDPHLRRISGERSDALGASTKESENLQRSVDYHETRLANLSAQYAGTTDPAQRSSLAAKVNAAAQRHSEAEEKLLSYDVQHDTRVNADAASQIRTYTKEQNVNSRTTTMSGQQKYFNMIRSGGRGAMYDPTESIEQRINQGTAAISTLGSSLASQQKGLGPEDWTQEMIDKSGRINEIQERVAADKRLLKMQNKAGLSTEKRLYGAESLASSIGGMISDTDIAQQAQQGKFGSFAEESEKLVNSFNKLNESIEKYDAAQVKLTDTTDMTADEVSKLKEEYKNASKELEMSKEEAVRQQKITREVGRGDGGGGAYGGARTFAGIAGVAARTASTIGLDLELEQTNMRTAFAGMANRQYMNVDKFVGGDMAAMEELTKGDAFAKNYSDTMRNRGAALRGGEVASAGLDAGISIAIAKSEAAKFSFQQGNIAAVNAAGATGRAAVMGTRLAYGTAQGAEAAKGYQSALALAQQLNAIPADTKQAFFDTETGAFRAGTGLGGARAGFMDNILSKTSRSKFVNAGITNKEAIGLSGAFAGKIGVTEDYSDLAVRAGRARMRGALSTEGYMEATAQLTATGGGSGDLESIMSKAVTAGMENAKNLNQMVSATTALAGGSAAAGLNTTAATSEMLLAGTQALQGFGVNKNIAVGAAASTLSILQQKGAQKGTFSDLQYKAKLGQLGFTGLDDQLALSEMGVADMKTMLSGSPEAGLMAKQWGFGDMVNEAGKFTSPGKRATFQEVLNAKSFKRIQEAMGVRAISDPDLMEELNAFATGETKSLSQRAIKAVRGSAAGMSAIGMGGSAAPTDVANKANSLADIRRGDDFSERELANQSMLKTTAKRLDDKIDQAIKLIGPGGLSSIAELMKEAVEQGGPEKMSKAVSDAAKDLTGPATIFKDGAGKFQGAVTDFINHLDKMGVSVSTPSPKEKVPRSDESQVKDILMSKGIQP